MPSARCRAIDGDAIGACFASGALHMRRDSGNNGAHGTGKDSPNATMTNEHKARSLPAVRRAMRCAATSRPSSEHRPRRGRADAESLGQQLEAIEDKHRAHADPLKRLHLIQAAATSRSASSPPMRTPSTTCPRSKKPSSSSPQSTASEGNRLRDLARGRRARRGLAARRHPLEPPRLTADSSRTRCRSRGWAPLSSHGSARRVGLAGGRAGSADERARAARGRRPSRAARRSPARGAA